VEKCTACESASQKTAGLFVKNNQTNEKHCQISFTLAEEKNSFVMTALQ
jgi:hypothetical protein